MATRSYTRIRLLENDSFTTTIGIAEPVVRAIAVAATAWAGVVHLALSAEHYEHFALLGFGFIAAGVAQVGWSLAALLRPSRPVYRFGIAINGVILGAWAWSRTYGSTHSEGAEGALEGLCLILEVVAILLVLKLLRSMSFRPLGVRDSTVQGAFGIGGFIAVPMLVFVMAFASGVGPVTTPPVASAHAHGAPGDSAIAATQSSNEPATHTVTALDNTFEPQRLTIAPGDTVEWAMEGKLPHTVSSDTGDFESGNLDPGQTFKNTFSEGGVYFYYCKYHGSPQQGMWGVIKVTDGGKVPVHAARQAASTSSGSTEPATFQVSSGDNFFSPLEQNVAVGDTVEWANAGVAIHNVTSDTGAFSSGDLTPGSRWSHTFTQEGTYNYFCTFHGSVGSGMWGVVTVTPPGEAPVSASPPPSDGGVDKLPPDKPGVVMVGMTLDEFDPVRADAQTGDRVRWFNNSTAPHTVTFEDGRKESGLLDPDESFQTRFTEPGRYY